MSYKVHELPISSNSRPLRDLALVWNVTPQTVYQADKRGEIGGVYPVGRMKRIVNEAYKYHAQHGCGRDVTPWHPEMENDAAGK